MEDRQTTKEMLAASLKELAKAKSVEVVSVREIVNNSGLTSTTFYNHFRNKYELMAWIYDMRLYPYFGELFTKYSWQDAIRQFSLILLEDPEFYENALKNTSGLTSFRYATNNFAIGMILERIRHCFGQEGAMDDIAFSLKYYMRMISEAINDWFLGGRVIPVEKFSVMLVDLMPPSLRPILLAEEEVRERQI